MNKTMSINNAKLEQLKSQDMLKAGDAADSIIEAADKDIFGMLVNEGKQNIDDNMKEQQEEAKKAEATAKAIFTGGDAANMPTAKLEADSFTDDEIDAINLVFGAGLATTKSEARRTIQQGGVSVDGEKVADIAAKFPKSMFEGDGVVVKKGKKSFVKVSVN